MIYVDGQQKKIPALGYGTWQLKDADCINGVSKALEIGYRHIDTAQIYENESEVGAAIAQSGIARSDIFLTTKVWMSNLKYGDFQKSVDESLSKLKTDYVDLLLIHWPVTQVSFMDQFKALMEVQASGKAKKIGVSNFTVGQMAEVVEKIGASIVTNQVEYHPFLSQKPVLDFLRQHDMFLTAYSPLARGKVKDDAVLKEIANKYGKNEGQVTLRWLLQQPNVVAIPKAASEKNIRDNFDIFDFSLSDDDMNRISALSRPNGRMVSPDWAPKWDQAA